MLISVCSYCLYIWISLDLELSQQRDWGLLWASGQEVLISCSWAWGYHNIYNNLETFIWASQASRLVCMILLVILTEKEKPKYVHKCRSTWLRKLSGLSSERWKMSFRNTDVCVLALCLRGRWILLSLGGVSLKWCSGDLGPLWHSQSIGPDPRMWCCSWPTGLPGHLRDAGGWKFWVPHLLVLRAPCGDGGWTWGVTTCKAWFWTVQLSFWPREGAFQASILGQKF